MKRLASFPRFPVSQLPTPLQRAERFEQALGVRSPRIYIKRDDLTGLAFGGNKARKLDYLIADALRLGATVVVTEGAAQSNHARMTAAAAALAGLKCILVLDARRDAVVDGNLFLDYLMGAEVRLMPTREDRRSMMESIGDELRERGDVPYIITTGGSMPIGSLGYVSAVAELEAQLDAIGEVPSHVFYPTGSQGTLAGMVVGAAAFNVGWLPVAIAVEDTAASMLVEALPLVRETAELLGYDRHFTGADIVIDDRHTGEGYGIPSDAGIEAIQLLARTEAMFLDPVYSGKAMAGLIAHVREGTIDPDGSIVFIHTGGGPSIFIHREVMLQGVPH